MKFTIPIDFEVQSTTEVKAELEVLDFLKRATLDYGNEYDIIDWYYTDFGSAIEEPRGAGRGDNNLSEGQPVQSAKQTCDDTIKAGECSRCCPFCKSIP